jgi:rhodanese-related sulfurtransferase
VSSVAIVARVFATAVVFATSAYAGDLACPGAGADAVSAASTYLPPDIPLVVPTSSVDAASLPAYKRTSAQLYLTAAEAGILTEAFGDRMLFVDVRTRAELIFNGMPSTVDAHIPFLLDPLAARWDDGKAAFALDRNPDFVDAVLRRLARKGLSRDDVVVLICQGGARAAMATNVLAQAGFARVYSVVDGFEGDPAPDGPSKGMRVVNGWRNAGLPWTTKLEKARMYGVD